MFTNSMYSKVKMLMLFTLHGGEAFSRRSGDGCLAFGISGSRFQGQTPISQKIPSRQLLTLCRVCVEVLPTERKMRRARQVPCLPFSGSGCIFYSICLSISFSFGLRRRCLLRGRKLQPYFVLTLPT